MPRSQAISSFLVGDPFPWPPTLQTPAELPAALDLIPTGPVGILPLAAGVALVHAPVENAGAPTLHWIRLPESRALVPGAGPVADAVVLAIPMAEPARGLRIASRLREMLRDPVVLEHARAARTRESLVRALAPAELAPGEAPLSSGETLALLASSPAGLDAAEVGRRRARAGENRIERARRHSMALRLLRSFTSLFAILLWAGGVLAFVAGMPQLGWAIFAVILINGIFSFLQEYRAERAIESLARLLPQQILVMRAGHEDRVPTVDLVPGDIVRIEEGDQIPADGQLLEAEGLDVDQSALTGESSPVLKIPHADPGRGGTPREEHPELVFAGTSVLSGAGTFVVSATGMTTEIGRIAKLTQGLVEGPSPLQREMAHVTRIVTVLAVALGGLFLVLGTATGALPLAEGFLFAIGVIVANVPEGLLPTLTLALAMAAQRMARRGILIRQLSSAETLGATTVICTDKTGTITENRMALRSVWVSGATHEAADLLASPEPDARELLEAAALASRATAGHGDPTEVALVRAAAAAGVDPDVARSHRRLLAPFPFDSFRKRMTNVYADSAGRMAYVKGAPVETLALCAAVRDHGDTRPLDEPLRRAFVAEHDRLAAEGLRLLAVAVRALPPGDAVTTAAEVEQDLTLLGMIALSDAPRAEVPDAIATCRRAGIRVVMVTGDHGLTARAIAARVGLPVRKLVTGAELDRLPREALRALAAEPGILFARVTPAHKLAVVTALHERGEVVAVTGDGVNDAPALKAADIGVAMGLRGSEVAKESAKMIITDDNFASIVSAVRQGRTIYANMGKFVTYIFASNIPELVPFLAFVLLGIPLPLTVMQVLAVDLGTDLLPALALAAEPPEPGLMDQPPRPRTQRLLNRGRLLRAYAFLGVAEAALAMGAFLWTYWLSGWRPGLPFPADAELYRRATTMTLAGIVACQVGNVFACRADRESVFRVGLLRNRFVLLGVAAELALFATLVAVPPLAAVFGLAAPRVAEAWPLLLFPPAMVMMDEMRKWLVRRGAARPAG